MKKSPRPRRKTQRKRVPPARPAAAAGPTVAVWEDDPGDPKIQPGPSPVTLPAPVLSQQPFPSRIGGATPPPKIYQPGSAEFRFYAAATSLRRTADFWGAIVGPVNWQVGRVLPVILDDGEDLNAFYTRGGVDAAGLHFFHQEVAGRTCFSGESPDIVSHEMGHAILDALRPQLFNAQTVEAAAFHEAFGDITAMLTALQLDTFRALVLSETGGVLNRASRLSRLAEQLGAAIRALHPDGVDRDCLRNAANSFFYRDPQTLPPFGPASQLTSEPHSFSRVFTAAFLDVLAGIFKTQPGGTSAELKASTVDAGRLLSQSISSAPVVPDYFSQIAAHMLSAGEGAPLNGKYRDVMKGAFVRRGILSLQGAAAVLGTKPPRASRGRGVAAMAMPTVAPAGELPKASITGTAYGLADLVLKVYTAEEPKRFAITSSSLTLGPLEPRSPQNAAESYTEDLFQRGRVDVGGHAHKDAGTVHPFTRKTHRVVRQNGDLLLQRLSFDCGFD